MQEIRSQKQQEQLKALQNQINPHFLYNSLDAIRGMAVENDAFEVADVVGILASMFKYTMDFRDTLVSISNEVSQVERYLHMQNIRFSNRFMLEKKMDCDPTDLTRLQLPKFTLQPLVENAVVHGLRNKVSDARITLRFQRTQKDFIIVVSDNGCGIDEEKVVNFNKRFADPGSPIRERGSEGGIALPNVDARIKFYFGQAYGLFVASAKNIGTDIEVRIPTFLNEP